MRLILINRFFTPDEQATAQLLDDLASALARTGLKVVVVASFSGQPRHPGQASLADGLRVHRVRTPGLAPGSMAGRCLDILCFTAGALRKLRKLARPGDVVICMTDPPPLNWLAPFAVGRQVRVIQWLQDLYPDIALAARPNSPWHALLQPLYWLRGAALRRSASCVVVSRGMEQRLRRRHRQLPPVHLIQNWATPPDLGPARPEQPPFGPAARGRFVVLYSGNLGRVHSLMPLLAAAALLSDEPEFLFVFAGEGCQKETLRSEASALKLGNVRFLPRQPRESLAGFLSSADLHVVGLQRKYEGLVFPSKLYGSLATGRPILLLGSADSEVARLLREHQCGVAVDDQKPAAVAQTLRELRRNAFQLNALGENGLRLHRESLAAAYALQAWRAVLQLDQIASLQHAAAKLPGFTPPSASRP